jgi:hypothetical protein
MHHPAGQRHGVFERRAITLVQGDFQDARPQGEQDSVDGDKGQWIVHVEFRKRVFGSRRHYGTKLPNAAGRNTVPRRPAARQVLGEIAGKSTALGRK